MTLQRFSFAFILFSLICSCSSDDKLNWQDVKKEIRQKFPDVKQLDIASFKKLKKENPGLLLLDTRSMDEYKVSHLKGAVHVDSLAKKDLAKDKVIVFYCSVGYRSSMEAAEFQQQGFAKVYNLEGSIFEWVNNGNPVYNGDMQVKKVHPYNKKWGELLDKKHHGYK